MARRRATPEQAGLPRSHFAVTGAPKRPSFANHQAPENLPPAKRSCHPGPVPTAASRPLNEEQAEDLLSAIDSIRHSGEDVNATCHEWRLSWKHHHRNLTVHDPTGTRFYSAVAVKRFLGIKENQEQEEDAEESDDEDDECNAVHEPHTAVEVQADGTCGVWRVERLLARRTRKDCVQWCVRWAGYGCEEDTWEDEENVDDTLIDEFNLSRHIKAPWRVGTLYLVERIVETRQTISRSGQVTPQSKVHWLGFSDKWDKCASCQPWTQPRIDRMRQASVQEPNVAGCVCATQVARRFGARAAWRDAAPRRATSSAARHAPRADADGLGRPARAAAG